MQDETKPSQQPAQPKKQLKINLPKELRPVYSNVAMISHTPAEMVIDFVQILPRSPQGNIEARIIMTPMHAKMLQIALSQNVAKFEQKFGEIRLPQQGSQLANDLFRPAPDESNDGDE